MTDISLVFNNDTGYADWAISDDGVIGQDNDLETAVLLSLFTDRVDPDYVGPDGKPDPRGWWGDTYQSSPVGSRLWQLQRTSITDRAKFLLRVNDLCREALDWMETSGLVSRIAVSSSFASPTSIAIAITVTEPTQSVRTRFEYAWAWGSI